MAKFCGKCGAKLDERTGLCPNCDGVPEMEKKAEPVPLVRSAPVTPQPAGQRAGRFCGRCGGPVDPQTGRCAVCDGAARYTPPVDVPSAMPPSAGNPAQTGGRDDVKKAHSATAASGRKSSRLIIWLLVGLLLAIVVIGGLAHFRVIPLEFVNDATEKVESLLGIEPYKGRKVSRETAYDDSGNRVWYHEYAYGADGKLASVTSYDGNGQQTARIEMQYDGQGRELIWWTGDYSGSVYVYATVQYASPTVRRIEYTDSDSDYYMQTLDDDGKMLEERFYREGGILRWTDYYVYDAKGRLTEIWTEALEDPDWWFNYSLTTYEYSGRTQTMNVYVQYEYDSAIYGYVQTDESWLEYQAISEYNERGDCISWTRYVRENKDAPLVKRQSQIMHYALDGTYTGYENFDESGNRTRYTTREFLSLWESIK